MIVEEKGQMLTIPSSGLAINVVGYGAVGSFPIKLFTEKILIQYNWNCARTCQFKQ